MAQERKKSDCSNCGFHFTGTDHFCPNCGQKNKELNVPVKIYLWEFLQHLFDFDAKSFRTVQALIFKPGFLSSQYNSGKRVNYISPIRLYLLISFLCFLLLSISSGTNDNQSKKSLTVSPKDSTESDFSISFRSIRHTELKYLTDSQIDSLTAARGIPLTPLNQYFLRQLKRVATTGHGEFGRLMMKTISYLMFVLMPFFAFLLTVFFFRFRKFYSEFLVIAIHFHSFIFLLFTFHLMINRFANFGFLFLITTLLSISYLFMMLKHIFQQKNRITGIKTFFIGVLYLLSIIAFFILTVFISLILF